MLAWMFLNLHQQRAVKKKKKKKVHLWVNRGDVCVAGTHFQFKSWWAKEEHRMRNNVFQQQQMAANQFLQLLWLSEGNKRWKAANLSPLDWFQGGGKGGGGSGCWLMKWGPERRLWATVRTAYPQSRAAFPDWPNHPTVAPLSPGLQGQTLPFNPLPVTPITPSDHAPLRPDSPRMSPPWSSL